MFLTCIQNVFFYVFNQTLSQAALKYSYRIPRTYFLPIISYSYEIQFNQDEFITSFKPVSELHC